MKHPKRTLIVLLVCVAGLAGALAWLHFSPSSSTSSSSSSSSESTVSLYSYKDSDLASMTVKNSTGTYTFVPDAAATAKAASESAASAKAAAASAGSSAASSAASSASAKTVFKIQELSGVSTSADTVSTAVQDGYSLSAIKNIGTAASSLAAYGLENPTITITSTFKSGKTITLLVGNETPLDTSARYVKLKDSDSVYAASISDTLLKGLPAYLSTQVTSISAPASSSTSSDSSTSSESSAVAMAFSKIDVKNQNGSFSLVRSGSSWSVNNRPADGDKVEILASAASAVSASSAVALDPTAAQLKTYGLTNPACTLSYTSTSGSGTLLIGGQESSGGYYVMMKGGRVAYLVESSSLSWLTQKAFDLQRTTILENTQTEIAGVTLKSSSASYNLVITRAKNASSSTEDNTAYTYTVQANGKKISGETAYSTFFTKAAALKVLEDSTAKPTGTPAWTLTLTGFDSKVHHTYQFYTSGDRRYLVTADGTTLGLVSSSDVDALATAAKAIQ
ncbi:MAG: DUF4340 domain-containing protein [Oscillospiraceae bacterium]|jgi:hypothetical protein|nr:DUF4340 domain-containing protein [Oscillospiraceae bacterium]MDD3261225.1 DUF4340 domain-containing protein [Oscillospiraceae bacterium]